MPKMREKEKEKKRAFEAKPHRWKNEAAMSSYLPWPV